MRVLARLYEKLWIHWWPELYGWCWLRWYQWLYGIQVGKRVRCWGRIELAKSAESTITIGDDVRIASDSLRCGVALWSRCRLQAFGRGEIHIGHGVAISGGSFTCRSTRIDIAQGAMIGPNVTIVDSDFHAIRSRDRRTDLGYDADRPVVIGKNAWIGMQSLVLKGVTIGENTVVAARSVVTTSLPANVVAGGHPARVLSAL